MSDSAHAGLVFSVLQGRAGFEALRVRWQALADSLPHATYLQQPGWIAGYLDMLDGDGRSLRFVTASGKGGELLAVLVLVRRPGRARGLLPALEMVHGPHMVLADLVADPGNTRLLPAMLDWLSRQRVMRWAVLRLPAVCAGSTLATLLQAHPTPRSQQTLRTHSAWLDCSGGIDQALRTVSKSFRTNLGRLARRANAQGELAYRVVSAPEELDAAFEAFLEVESSGWKRDSGTAIAQDDRLVAFYRRLVREFGARGACRIHLLTLDGQPVAAQFGLLSDRQLNLLKIGFSQAHAPLAPGNLIMLRTIEQVCADPDVDRLSFVTDPLWSQAWRPHRTPVDHVTVYPATLVGDVLFRAALWRERRRARMPQPTEVALPAGPVVASAQEASADVEALRA